MRQSPYAGKVDLASVFFNREKFANDSTFLGTYVSLFLQRSLLFLSSRWHLPYFCDFLRFLFEGFVSSPLFTYFDVVAFALNIFVWVLGGEQLTSRTRWNIHVCTTLSQCSTNAWVSREATSSHTWCTSACGTTRACLSMGWDLWCSMATPPPCASAQAMCGLTITTQLSRPVLPRRMQSAYLTPTAENSTQCTFIAWKMNLANVIALPNINNLLLMMNTF